MGYFSKKWVVAFRIVFAIAAYGFIFIKLYRQGVTGILEDFNGIAFSRNLGCLMLAIVLMPLSWIVEAFKWQRALMDVEEVGIFRALKSVWYGVAAGLLTPNRTGDPFGRMVFISPHKRGKAIVLGIWCGISQLLATLLFGFVGLFYWLGMDHSGVDVPFGNPLYTILFIVALVVAILVFMQVGSISRVLQRLAPVKKLLVGESLEITVKPWKSLAILMLSLVRYTIFSTQFVLLLKYFGVNGDTAHLYAGVFLSYLFAGVVPSFAVTEVVVRSGFAVAFIGLIDPNTVAIVASTIVLWGLNVALPTLIAVWFPWYNKEGAREK